MLSKVQQWIASKQYPNLDWFQVEITTRCDAACSYCPRTIYHDQWQNRDLTPDLFTAALPIMKKAKIVHLQGWGEPFLHPDFFRMIRLAKSQGCCVTSTTNGNLIGDAEIEEIFSSGLDMLSFSLAGFGAVNDSVRNGTDSSHITATIRKIYLKKLALKRTTPRLHVSFLLLSSALSEIEKIPTQLAGIGVDQVVISTLDFLANTDLQAEAIRPVSRADYAWLCDELSRIAEKSRRAGLDVYYRIASPDDAGSVCSENVLKSIFLCSDGSIAPCAFSAIPVSRVSFCDGHCKRKDYAPILFGSLKNKPFPFIWKSPGLRQFHSSFSDNKLMPLCSACPKRFQ